eukprot:CAMPEP_0172036258 /NCGR_PEP_ID=MMETSP1041-20130122/22068_1 /TAXON_ID=464988 /ORGANISM="Hemiselmis andersenii, Strain CCMP439" /LENGTH=90 /DNA_ID=CAMNT_0012693475 /DNA_START=20 /DNA_END=289 /DNA_ORIENTATION=-
MSGVSNTSEESSSARSPQSKPFPSPPLNHIAREAAQRGSGGKESREHSDEESNSPTHTPKNNRLFQFSQSPDGHGPSPAPGPPVLTGGEG